jgi:hypothetical protein
MNLDCQRISLSVPCLVLLPDMWGWNVERVCEGDSYKKVSSVKFITFIHVPCIVLRTVGKKRLVFGV